MNKLWRETLGLLEQQLPPQHFSTWIKPIRFISVDKDLVKLEVPNRFILDWINEHYLFLIKKLLEEVGAIPYQVKVKVGASPKEAKVNQFKETNKEPLKPNTETLSHQKDNTWNGAINLNPKYTFEEFVSGSSNQFASAAAMAVANNPATTYNPLFIYGGVGLGKTHLINAIGNKILTENPSMKVCYYTSEKFMNELINSLRYAKMDEFRNKFRSMDVLLIDDVQFIAGKERTQEEFFHTFNSLYESHKQIVVTSDKFPKEIPGLEERLRSRFEWGLIADIQAPDVETKQAILKMKAEQNRIHLPEDVALFLSNSISSNVRELEGYLVRLGAYASLTATPVSLTMAKEVLKDILVEKNKEITVEEIQKIVAAYYNLKIIDLKSSKRLKTLVLPRQIAMYLSRQLTSCSFPDIGEKFGGKDHSTIIHAIKKIEKAMDDDMQLRVTISNIKNSITN
ncbi:chromosomal replication initiator protein DnaA [Desulfuromonas sp. KJ2020]|uniref:chromosomal replication initiator protein DnaA n=1 Tax=Desulfuromonas sp. KJ2020 TaxID=2919173 RepID=UPI0020A75C10|nr:chromosomal replication initiator protein DnaA [Desulfuromonas sp. KJ2020]MCP3176185.1 chromosomal replication initiator protein DnaA [Desulfuromonas sp. KJ2020]